MKQKSYDNTPTLYIVPTPIGNLQDMTFRAVRTLKESEVVFCEDTRITMQLLQYYEINKKLISNHKYNEFEIKEKILSYLEKGQSISLVSDRGTPGISDPGYVAIQYIIEKGYNVVCLPGSCALIPAVVMSGLNTDRFLFFGFLNNKPTKQKEQLKTLVKVPHTMIFYESPHRIKRTLQNMLDVFGNRNISLVREISKLYEEIIRMPLTKIIENIEGLKGELVIVVEGAKEDKEDFSNISIIEQVKKYLKDGMNEKDAIKLVAKKRGLQKNEVYMEYHGR